jgi:hypothetical protein
MMSPARRLDDASTTPVSTEVAKTVREIEDGDVVVVNRDGRTWLITDVADVSVSDDDTDRQKKRAVRMQSRRKQETYAATVALVLVEYPDHKEAAVHVLDAANRLEKDGVYAVDHVEILNPEPTWVVVQRAGTTDAFHLPAPVPAARGDALPACGGRPGDVDAEEYRLVSRMAITPGPQICRDCARRQRPRELETVVCPDCERNIASGLLQGPRSQGVTGLRVECPESDCSFTGAVDLPAASSGNADGQDVGGVA